ncbi:MAG: radical SAM protein [Acidobacteriota bacterium]|nr:MAG: radical SAM protein [Acidobacteriota bacterium]
MKAAPTQICRLCGRRSCEISAALSVCGSCIRSRPEQALAITVEMHRAARRRFGLPDKPPRTEAGRVCPLCVSSNSIKEGERGFCGLRTVRDGRLVHLAGTPRRGMLRWYRDPLPTNCVADWVCAGHRHVGCHNLAVFYASCTLDCLFCQNWSFRDMRLTETGMLSAENLAELADERTFCVCFFGGDPASQMPHALASAHRLARRGVTICWETAGTSDPKLIDRAVELALETGGCIKFDLKAWSEQLHRALTGRPNHRTLENLARSARRFDERPDPPLVVASTLLVPGYVDANEVGAIAGFIAELNPAIPYALLGFAPRFMMTDLPPTSIGLARAAERAARAAGLINVRLGNRHLLVS